jgi:hypothetical protein
MLGSEALLLLNASAFPCVFRSAVFSSFMSREPPLSSSHESNSCERGGSHEQDVWGMREGCVEGLKHDVSVYEARSGGAASVSGTGTLRLLDGAVGGGRQSERV